jgi:phosphonate transport system substrate-binding protein
MGFGLNHRLDKREFLSATVSVLLASTAGTAAQTATNGPIRFGLTPVFLTNDLELLGRLQSYLQRATGHPVELVTRRTYQEITTLLTTGQLDAAWICGFPYVAHRTELQLVAVPLWHHKPLYQSYLIVDLNRKGSDILDLPPDFRPTHLKVWGSFGRFDLSLTSSKRCRIFVASLCATTMSSR